MAKSENLKNRMQPRIAVPGHIDVREAEVRTACNGVKVYLLDCSADDVVRVSFVFHAGSAFQDMPFQASAAANMLSEGTGKYTSQEISERLDFLGSYFDVSMDRDYVVVTFCTLSRFFDQTMEIARQIVMYPVFPEKELAVYCSKRKQRLVIERSKVGFRSREYLSRALFGASHPYGVSYPAEDYDKLTVGALREFYRKFYTAANSFVVCSGKLPPEVCDSMVALANELPMGQDVTAIEFPPAVVEKYFYEKQSGAVQSAIRIGTPLFTKSHPDFIAMQVVATILGGYFGSRLVRNLREKRGYTYGIFAGMVNMDREGYMAIGTEVAAGATHDAIEQIFAETERLRSDSVSEEELSMVRNIMAGEIMRVLDGPFGIADVTIENIQSGLSNSYLNRMMDEVRSITPDRILEVAQRYLARERFSTVVVGEGLPE